MSNFAPGDVVVCVDAGAGDYGPTNLVENAFYRVSQVRWHPGERNFGVDVWEVPSVSPYFYRPSRFRKIEAPKTELSARIKACRPVRRGVDA